MFGIKLKLDLIPVKPVGNIRCFIQFYRYSVLQWGLEAPTHRWSLTLAQPTTHTTCGHTPHVATINPINAA